MTTWLIGQWSYRAEHQLAIRKLERQGPAGFASPRVARAALGGKSRKSRVRRLAESGETVQGHPEGEQTVAEIHRTAAGIGAVNDDLAQTTASGRGLDQGAEGVDVFDGCPLIEALAFVHHRDDFIDEAVETDDDIELLKVPGAFAQPGRQTRKLCVRIHGHSMGVYKPAHRARQRFCADSWRASLPKNRERIGTMNPPDNLLLSMQQKVARATIEVQGEPPVPL